MQWTKVRAHLRRYGIITLGSVCYALAFQWFFAANGIAYGGVTGVAQLLHALLRRPGTGVWIAALNLPLFFLGWRKLGREMLIRSVYSVAVSALLIVALGALHPFAPMDPMLAAVFGGVGLGGSLGVLFRQGATTGGTDIAAQLLRRKLPGVSMGRLVLALDLGVIVGCALAFGRLESALYGLVALYLSSVAIDRVLYGPDSCRLAYVITDRQAAVAQAILRQLRRGVTVLPGRGGFSGQARAVLLCAVRRGQMLRLKRTVQREDPGAFLVVCDAREVLGEGFPAEEDG